jgi:hypothetical protein
MRGGAPMSPVLLTYGRVIPIREIGAVETRRMKERGRIYWPRFSWITQHSIWRQVTTTSPNWLAQQYRSILIFEGCSFRISSGTPTLLTKDFRPSQCSQGHTTIVPRLGHDLLHVNPFQFIIYHHYSWRCIASILKEPFKCLAKKKDQFVHHPSQYITTISLLSYRIQSDSGGVTATYGAHFWRHLEQKVSHEPGSYTQYLQSYVRIWKRTTANCARFR